MTTKNEIFRDAFNFFLGRRIGGGVSRDVFLNPYDPSTVIKVMLTSPPESQKFSNVFEFEAWESFGKVEGVGNWLAPCISLSINGLILLQRRVMPLPSDMDLPKTLPAFLHGDTKRENFGLLNGQIVCCDYPRLNFDAPTKQQKVVWYNDA